MDYGYIQYSDEQYLDPDYPFEAYLILIELKLKSAEWPTGEVCLKSLIRR
jgi:hypothetical protein